MTDVSGGRITVRFNADVRNAIRGFNQYSTRLTKLSSTTRKRVKDIRQSLNTLNLAVGAGLGAALIKLGADFDKAITNVRAITKEAADDFEETRERVLEVGDAYGVAGAEAGRALFDIVSAGFRGAQAMDTLEASVQGAKAGLVDTQVATNVLVGTLNSFQLGGDEAEATMGKLIKTVDLGILTFEQLAASLGTVAPLANAAGLTLEELLGILASLTKSGLSFDLAATQVRAALTALIKPGAEAEVAIRRVLGTTAEAAIASKGFSTVLQELIESAGGSNEALAEIFPNVRALSGVIALATSGFEGLGEAIGDLESAGGDSLRETFEIQVQTIGELISSIRALVTNELNRWVEDNRSSIQELLTVTREFISENRGLVSGLGTAIAAIGALTAAGLTLKVLFIALEGLLVANTGLMKGLAFVTGVEAVASFSKLTKAIGIFNAAILAGKWGLAANQLRGLFALVATGPGAFIALAGGIGFAAGKLIEFLNPVAQANKLGRAQIKVLKDWNLVLDERQKRLNALRRSPTVSPQDIDSTKRLIALQEKYVAALDEINNGNAEAAEAASNLRDRIREAFGEDAVDPERLRGRLEERLNDLNKLAAEAAAKLIQQTRKVAEEEGKNVEREVAAIKSVLEGLTDADALDLAIQRGVITEVAQGELRQLEGLLKNLDGVYQRVADASERLKTDLVSATKAINDMGDALPGVTEDVQNLLEGLRDENASDEGLFTKQIQADLEAIELLKAQLQGPLREAVTNLLPKDGSLGGIDIAALFPDDPDAFANALFGDDPIGPVIESIKSGISQLAQDLADAKGIDVVDLSDVLLDEASLAIITDRFAALGLEIGRTQAEAILGQLRNIDELDKAVDEVTKRAGGRRAQILGDAESELEDLRIERLRAEGKELEARQAQIERDAKQERAEIEKTGKLAVRIAELRRRLASDDLTLEQIAEINEELEKLTEIQKRQLEEVERIREENHRKALQDDEERKKNTDEYRKLEEKLEKQRELARLLAKKALLEQQIQQAKMNGLVREEARLKGILLDTEKEIERATEGRVRATDDLSEKQQQILRRLQEQLRINDTINGTDERRLTKDAQRDLVGTDDVFDFREGLRENFDEADTKKEATDFARGVEKLLELERRQIETDQQRLRDQIRNGRARGEDTSSLERELSELDEEYRANRVKLQALVVEYNRIIKVLKREAEEREKQQQERDKNGGADPNAPDAQQPGAPQAPEGATGAPSLDGLLNQLTQGDATVENLMGVLETALAAFTDSVLDTFAVIEQKVTLMVNQLNVNTQTLQDQQTRIDQLRIIGQG
jgi:TP901 family phage tail tape measure protein